ncbi:cell death abnormality protein 1-like [Haliotis cracherodii]|uniref:cell death abnormality protein 1-like n=1 Tax=Haliotis cracherodii TaxID=6455 RepID=UPI0039EA7110
MFLSNLQLIMTSVVILCFAPVLLFIQAKPCDYSRNCVSCDDKGYCTSDCDPGYFGKRCISKCSSGCRNRSCELLTDGGTEVCTHGCISGFQGTRCNIPCDENWRQCTECKGGCVGKYCQLGSSCVSGCVDSYYGLDCKNCSGQCKLCNRSTGICDQCHSPYTGPNCEMSCENCKGTCKTGCKEGCNRGFYGHWCEKVCSENCRAGPDACDRNASKKCSPECDHMTGFCIHGCNGGWFGANCSTQCNPMCVNMSCTDSGTCVAGCAPGYAGSDCSCLENCIEHICFSEDGTCAKGCANGYYGAFCNTTCEICIDGICDQESGTCTKGCNITDQRCKSTCSSDCPIDTCVKEITCEPTSQSLPLIIIGTSSACGLVGIMVAVCIGCYGRTKRQETDKKEEEYPAGQPEAHQYELMDIDPDKNETGPVIVFL